MSKIRYNDKIIEAQNYGIGNKLREKFTPSGWRRMLGETFSDSYKNRMSVLKEADERIREEAMPFKGKLGNTFKAFKDGRFIDVAHWVSEINDGVLNIIKYGKIVTDLRDDELAEFYTRTENANIFENYFDKKPEIDEQNSNDGLQATAGVADFFNRMMGTSLEKTYYRRIKERKLAVQSLIKETEKLVSMILASLDRMGKARAQGDISTWITEFERIKLLQPKFQAFFKSIYDKHIADLVGMLRKREPTPETSSPFSPPAEEEAEPFPLTQTKQVAPQEQPAVENKPDSIPVVQELKLDSGNEPVQEQAKRERGRPRIGDKDRQFDQLENLMNQLKNQTPQVESPPTEMINKQDSAVKSDKLINPVPAAPEAQKSEFAPKSEPVPISTPDPLPESVKAPEPIPAPAPNAQERPMRVNIRGRNKPAPAPQPEPPKPVLPKAEEKAPEPIVLPESVEESKSEPVESDEPKEQKAEEPTNKKVTLIVLPKGGADNLDVLEENLRKELDRKIIFVTKDGGRETYEDYKQKGFDVDVKLYDEVKQYSGKAQQSGDSLLKLLDDPKFIDKLPRNSIGDFHMPLVFDMPQFEKVDKKTHDLIVHKLIEMREKEVADGTNVAIPEEMSPPDIDESEEVLEEPANPEDEAEQAIFAHTGEIAKKVDKPLKDLTQDDVFELLVPHQWYWDLLPKNKDGLINVDLVKQFPEYKLLDADYAKVFDGQVNAVNKDIKKKKRVANDVEQSVIKYSHQKFFNQLEKVSKINDVNLMIAMLCKYSDQIEDVDPDTSKKLLQYALKLND